MEQPKKLKRHFFLWVLLIGLGLMLVGSMAGESALATLRVILPPSDSLEFLFIYLAFIGIDAAVLIYCYLAEKPIFQGMLWQSRGGMRGNTPQRFLLGLLVGFLANGVCILAAFLHGDVRFSFGGFRPLYLLAALICVLIQSGAEELLTRGYMLGALRERYNVPVAVALNSLFFGALHLFNDGVTLLSVVNIVLVGVAMSLTVVYLDSLWICVAFHTMWNFTQNFLFGLPNSGIVAQGSLLHLEAASDSLLYHAVFGVEGAVPATLVILALCIVPMAIRKK